MLKEYRHWASVEKEGNACNPFPPKVKPLGCSIVYPDREYFTFSWKVYFPVLIMKVWTKDKPAASFFLWNSVHYLSDIMAG